MEGNVPVRCWPDNSGFPIVFSALVDPQGVLAAKVLIAQGAMPFSFLRVESFLDVRPQCFYAVKLCLTLWALVEIKKAVRGSFVLFQLIIAEEHLCARKGRAGNTSGSRV